jgi:hypothetical protein
VGPRASLDDVEKRKFLTLPGLEPGRPARNLSLYRLSYPGSYEVNVLRLKFISNQIFIKFSRGGPHTKHRFLYCCVLIHCCRVAFIAQLRSNERGADPQRTPLAAPILLLPDVTAYMTRSSAACVLAIT